MLFCWGRNPLGTEGGAARRVARALHWSEGYAKVANGAALSGDVGQLDLARALQESTGYAKVVNGGVVSWDVGYFARHRLSNEAKTMPEPQDGW
jgi:hypothetical protein